jgi:hypothetical protein
MSTDELKKNQFLINNCPVGRLEGNREKNNKVNYSTIQQFKTKKYRPNIVQKQNERK